jgi:hypothetical protein
MNKSYFQQLSLIPVSRDSIIFGILPYFRRIPFADVLPNDGYANCYPLDL